MTYPDTARETLLAELREATGTAHRALDAGLNMAGPAITTGHYGDFLVGSLAAVAPLELALAPFELLSSGRSVALRLDLASLGRTELTAEPAPRITTLAEAMGATYVVEGSSLGGLFLARAVADALPDAQVRYLRLHGGDTRAVFAAFVARLERWGTMASHAERQLATRAALATFEWYRRQMARAGAWVRA